MADYSQERTSSSSSIFLDVNYVKSLDSVFKIIEMIFGMCTFISACVWGTIWGGGWVQFVGIFSFIVILIYFVLKLLGLVGKFPSGFPITLIELLTCVVFTVFFLIAGIVAAVKGWVHSSIASAAAFSFFSMAAFAMDSFLKFQEWRSGGGVVRTSEGATTTTTTHTVTMTNEQDPKY